MPTHTANPLVNSRYQKHRKDWLKCEACSLCKTRSQVVLYKGALPCDVLFIGEAPGDSEDAVGEPFVDQAPAGELLDYIITEAFQKINAYRARPNPPLDDLFKKYDRTLKVGFTNIVACRPKSLPDEYSSGRIRPPDKDEIEACKERLHEIITLASPRLIVTLGDLARKHLPTTDAKVLNLIHPAAILRMEDRNKVTAEKRAILNLARALP